MFDFFKRKPTQKEELHRGFHHAQQWKQNPQLQRCFGALRGSFTVAQAYHQEAVEATIAIAANEDNWTDFQEIPTGFLGEKCYIFWNDPTLPMLLCQSVEVLCSLPDVAAVAGEVYLISETMDRILHLADNVRRQYSIS